MILETIRMIADALESEVYGVNVQLQTLFINLEDTTPDDVEYVADETRDADVAVGRYPEAYPCLVVTLDGTVPLNGEVVSNYRDGELNIIVRYIHDSIETAKARTNAYYTLRAVQKCLRVFFSNLYAEDREQNGVQILECLSVEHVPMYDNISDTMVISGLRVKMFVRDTTP